MLLILAYGTLATLPRIAGIAPGDPPTTEKNPFFPSQLNFAVPASAALNVLGVDPSKAQLPTGLQSLTFGLINSFDESGHLKNGFAFNFPYLSLGKQNVADVYQNQGKRRLYFTNFSAAAIKGSEADPTARAAFSLSIPLVNETDWRANPAFQKEVDAKFGQIDHDYEFGVAEANGNPAKTAQGWNQTATRLDTLLTGLTRVNIGKYLETYAANKEYLDKLKDKTIKQLLDTRDSHWQAVEKAKNAINLDDDPTLGPKKNALYNDARKKLGEKYDKLSWNQTKVDFSAAYSLFAPDAEKDGLKGEGTYLTLGAAIPFGDGQLSAIGRYANKDRSWDKDTKAWKIANSSEFAVRFRGGSKDGGAFIEYLDGTDDVQDGKKVKRHLFQLGYETKIGDKQWLQIAVGGGGGAYSKTVLGVNLSFNLSPDRQINERGEVQK